MSLQSLIHGLVAIRKGTKSQCGEGHLEASLKLTLMPLLQKLWSSYSVPQPTSGDILH